MSSKSDYVKKDIPDYNNPECLFWGYFSKRISVSLLLLHLK